MSLTAGAVRCGAIASRAAVSTRAAGLGSTRAISVRAGLGLPGLKASRPARQSRVMAVAVPAGSPEPEAWSGVTGTHLKKDIDLSQAPPFTLQDIRNAVPSHLWKRNTVKSFAYMVWDVAVVAGLAYAAHSINQWWLWPLYYIAQGTMFWALFVVGHDCGHRSFSPNNHVNDFVGNIVHSSILVPYHGWRISHRTHHANHGHVENDESWHPVSKSLYDSLDQQGREGRFKAPTPLFAFPFYLWSRSPGKQGSHYDPSCDLFAPSERKMIMTSNAFMLGMLGVIAAATWKLGFLAMLNLYWIPYIVNVVWLDAVTYLHHHGPSDTEERVPWYRGEEWSYLRGGLSTLDRDFGIFNKIHHDIGTHVLHHLFERMPHYNLCKATEAVKPVMGDYYREPEKCTNPLGLPFHLIPHLMRSFRNDHFVADEGDVVFYQRDPALYGN